MKHTLITKSGKQALVDELYDSHIVRWQLSSREYLSEDEVCELIERERPSPGYGESTYRRKPMNGDLYIVEVTSGANCE